MGTTVVPVHQTWLGGKVQLCTGAANQRLGQEVGLYPIDHAGTFIRDSSRPRPNPAARPNIE